MSKMSPSALQEIWHARCPVPTPLNLAVQLGWVADALRRVGNLQLKSSPDIGDSTAPIQYHESPLPNSFRHGGSVPAIWARANGQKTRVVGLTWTDEYQALIALPTAGITRVDQLYRRRIGIPRHDVTIDHSRAAALRGVSALLATSGLGFADVELVDLLDHPVPSVTRDGAVIATGNGRRGQYRYINEVHALARGDVDAVYVKDTSGAQATHLLGAMVIGNIGFHPDPIVRINNGTPRPLTVSQYLLDEHPEVVRSVLTQVVLAGDWARANRDLTVALAARETGASEGWVRYAYGSELNQNLRVGLSPSWVAGLDSFKQFLHSHGFLASDFSVDDWIDPRPLHDVLDQLAGLSDTQRRVVSAPGVTPQSSMYH